MSDAIKNELQNLLGRPSGRRFLAWLLFEVCGIYQGDPPDNALAQSFRAGCRNVGLALVSALESADPYALTEIMKELANERRRSESASRGRDD